MQICSLPEEQSLRVCFRFSHQFGTLQPARGDISCCCVFPVPPDFVRERESVRVLPRSFWTHSILFQHFGINEVVEVGIVLESLNLAQLFLVECYPVFVHVIGLPLGGVLVAFGHQATVVPFLVDALKTQEEFACHLPIVLVFQFNSLPAFVIFRFRVAHLARFKCKGLATQCKAKANFHFSC